MNLMLVALCLFAQGAYPPLFSLAFFLEPELFLALHLLPQRKETRPLRIARLLQPARFLLLQTPPFIALLSLLL